MERKIKSLSSILTRVISCNDLSAVICRKDGVDISWKKFLLDVSNLYQILFEEQVSEKYLVYCKSSYQFLVALFSVWQAGSVCVLPPNNSKEVLKKFDGYVGAFITDQLDDDCGMKRIAPLQNDSESGNIKFKDIPENQIRLELFTSGTTGERKCIKKTIANLSLELQDLYERFGTMLTNARTFSTVSHQHIYGLLHKILLPVCTDRLFIDETYFYPEKLIVDMDDGEYRNVLISGPAHLKLLPELVNLSGMNKFCRAIFSSGSLLDTESAKKISLLSGIRPVEVLGSTETGGVAWRIQGESEESKKWTSFKSVQIRKSTEGFLQVNSPFVLLEDPDSSWFTMGDLVDIYDNDRFFLRGRGDRIVKIGEKRVSLEEMEKRLKICCNIKSCKVFPITVKRSSSDRTILACVVESHVKPKDRVERKMIVEDFKSCLLQYFTQTLVPKYWRFVQKMPLDPQGKISVEDLRKLFRKVNDDV